MLSLLRARRGIRVPPLERLLLRASTGAWSSPAVAAATSSTPARLEEQADQRWRTHSTSSSPADGSDEVPGSSFVASADTQYSHEQQQRQPPNGSGSIHSAAAAENEEFEKQRQQLLAATLRHVPQHGWAGGAAAAAAAAELGLSPAAAGMLGSDAEVVQHFVANCNQHLEEELAGMQQQLGGMEMRERLMTSLQLRLHMLEPHIGRWPQALSLLSQPAAAPRTLQLYADLADTVWHAAGDTSTDATWYTKRALLTGAYTATELYMLTDYSPGFAKTWAALGRRLEGVIEIDKAAEDVGSLAGAVGNAAGTTLAQLTGLLGRQS